MARRLTLAALVLAVSASCSANSNVFLGEVKAELDGHPAKVTDCYRFSAPVPERLATAAGSEVRWAPCKDAVIVIRADELTVNNQSYGKLKIGQKILVDHGKVSIE